MRRWTTPLLLRCAANVQFTARSLYSSRIARRDTCRWDWFNNHAAGADDAAVANVRHDDGTVAEPRIGSNLDCSEGAALCGSRNAWILVTVLVSSAEDVDITADQGMIANTAFSDRTPAANVHSHTDGNLRMRKICAKPHGTVTAELVQAHQVEPAPEEDPRHSRKQAQGLAAGEEEPVAHATPPGKTGGSPRRERYNHGQHGDSVSQQQPHPSAKGNFNCSHLKDSRKPLRSDGFVFPSRAHSY